MSTKEPCVTDTLIHVKLTAIQFLKQRASNHPIDGYSHDAAQEATKKVEHWSEKDLDKVRTECMTLLSLLEIPNLDVNETPIDTVRLAFSISRLREALLLLSTEVSVNENQKDIFVRRDDYRKQFSDLQKLISSIEETQQDILNQRSELDNVQIGLFGSIQISLGAVQRLTSNARTILTSSDDRVNISLLSTLLERARKSVMDVYRAFSEKALEIEPIARYVRTLVNSASEAVKLVAQLTKSTIANPAKNFDDRQVKIANILMYLKVYDFQRYQSFRRLVKDNDSRTHDFRGLEGELAVFFKAIYQDEHASLASDLKGYNSEYGYRSYNWEEVIPREESIHELLRSASYVFDFLESLPSTQSSLAQSVKAVR